MSRVLSVIALLLLASPASAVTGNAPPAAGWAARAIVMIVDTRDDLCTGTALTPDLVLTAAHCVVRNVDYQVKAYQAGGPIPVRTIARHPRFDHASYAASRAVAGCGDPGVTGGTAARRGRRNAHHCRLRRHPGGNRAWARPAAHGDTDRDRQTGFPSDPPLRHRHPQPAHRAWRLHRRFRRARL